MRYLDRLKQFVKSKPVLYPWFRSANHLLYLRFRHRPSFARYVYLRAVQRLADVTKRYGFTGGQLSPEGDFYLRGPHGIYLYCNYGDPALTFGDGQSLDFLRNHLEPPLLRWLLDAMPPEGVYFDVGANNGIYYAMLIAREFPGAQVHAFEPDERILVHLRKNLVFNRLPNVTTHRVALTSFDGESRLTAVDGASNFLVAKDQDGFATSPVRCVTLDSFLAQNSLTKIDFLKVDIEGGEFGFLRGAQNCLRTMRPAMILELNDSLLKRSGSSFAEVVEFLKSLRYEIFPSPGTNDFAVIPAERTDLRDRLPRG